MEEELIGVRGTYYPTEIEITEAFNRAHAYAQEIEARAVTIADDVVITDDFGRTSVATVRYIPHYYGADLEDSLRRGLSWEFPVDHSSEEPEENFEETEELSSFLSEFSHGERS